MCKLLYGSFRGNADAMNDYLPASQGWTQDASSCTLVESSEDVDERDFFIEELETSGEALLDAIRGLVRQHDVRRIIVQNKDGNSLLYIPMAFDAIGSLVSVDLSCESVSLSVIAAIVSQPHILIERYDGEPHPLDRSKQVSS